MTNYSMNDDIVSDWFEDEEYISPNVDQVDDSWGGVDETIYTTKIDHSQITAEQMRRAEMLAAEIQRDSVSRNPLPTRQFHSAPVPQWDSEAANISSQADAMEYLRKRKEMMNQQQQMQSQQSQSIHQQNPQAYYQQQQQQQQHQQHQHQPVTAAVAGVNIPQPNAYVSSPEEQYQQERALVGYLQSEMGRVVQLIGSRGNPTGPQAKKLIGDYAARIREMVPYSPVEVKVAVIKCFEECNWDLPKRQPVPGSVPPKGRTICDLIFKLGKFFSPRVGVTPPPDDYVDRKLAQFPAPRPQLAAAPAPRQPAYGNPSYNTHHGGKGKGQGQKGGKGKGKGKGGKGQGKGGKGGGKGKGYQQGK